MGRGVVVVVGVEVASVDKTRRDSGPAGGGVRAYKIYMAYFGRIFMDKREAGR